MAFCHSSQDTLRAAKNTRIPKHQNYVGRLQHVLSETRQNFHSINPQETLKGGQLKRRAALMKYFLNSLHSG